MAHGWGIVVTEATGLCPVCGAAVALDVSATVGLHTDVRMQGLGGSANGSAPRCLGVGLRPKASANTSIRYTLPAEDAPTIKGVPDA